MVLGTKLNCELDILFIDTNKNQISNLKKNMSLDVSLIIETPILKKGTGIYSREGGSTVELTYEQVKKRFPDVVIDENEYETNEVFDKNITHNLNTMADEAGLYEALWRPYKLKVNFDETIHGGNLEYKFETENSTIAEEIIPTLKKGLETLKNDPKKFKKFNPSNGWGSYEQLVNFTEEYLEACLTYPNSKVVISR